MTFGIWFKPKADLFCDGNHLANILTTVQVRRQLEQNNTELLDSMISNISDTLIQRDKASRLRWQNGEQRNQSSYSVPKWDIRHLESYRTHILSHNYTNIHNLSHNFPKGCFGRRQTLTEVLWSRETVLRSYLFIYFCRALAALDGTLSDFQLGIWNWSPENNTF